MFMVADTLFLDFLLSLILSLSFFLVLTLLSSLSLLETYTYMYQHLLLVYACRIWSIGTTHQNFILLLLKCWSKRTSVNLDINKKWKLLLYAVYNWLIMRPFRRLIDTGMLLFLMHYEAELSVSMFYFRAYNLRLFYIDIRTQYEMYFNWD